MDEQPFVLTSIYSDGQIAAGAPCVPVILELSNRLLEPLVVSWVNRVFFADDIFVTPVPDAFFPNVLTVCPGETALVKNLFASSPGFHRTLLRMQSASSGTAYWIFEFSAEAGYYLAKVPRSAACCPAPVPCPFSLALAQGSAYAPAFAGSRKPGWQFCIIFPTLVSAGPALPCMPPGLGGPCIATPQCC